VQKRRRDSYAGPPRAVACVNRRGRCRYTYVPRVFVPLLFVSRCRVSFRYAVSPRAVASTRRRTARGSCAYFRRAKYFPAYRCRGKPGSTMSTRSLEPQSCAQTVPSRQTWVDYVDPEFGAAEASPIFSSVSRQTWVDYVDPEFEAASSVLLCFWSLSRCSSLLLDPAEA
jgi:hypothetical protein